MKLKALLSIILLISFGIAGGQGLCTLTCPVQITVSNDPGNCSASVLTPDASLSGDCDLSTLQWELTGATTGSGSGQLGTYTFNVGTTTVTYTIDDSNGDPSECSFTVTVNDNENPTITCPADITQSNDPGNCDAYVTVPLPFTSDNCGISSLTNDYTGTGNSSGIYPVGTTTVTFTAIDNSGNLATCSHNVTVTDNETPVITCPPDTTIACPEDYFPPILPIVTDNCQMAIIELIDESYDSLGIHPGWCPTAIYRTYQATDAAGNTATCMQTIAVDDICYCRDCTDDVPHYIVDLTNNPDSVWHSTPPYPEGVRRKGLCCNQEWPDKCISFGITLHSEACGLLIEVTDGQLSCEDPMVQIDCGASYPMNDTILIPSGEYHNITFCCPGDDTNQYQITSVPCASLGVGEVRGERRLTIYPNPTTGITRIQCQFTNKHKGATLYIYNLLGHPVASLEDPDNSGNFKEFLWDPEGLPGGMYFVRLEAGGQSVTGKVVLRE